MDYQSARRTDKTQWKPKIANDKKPFIWWLWDAFRTTSESGCLICFCGWQQEDVFKMAIDCAGYEVQSQVVWDREHHGMGDLGASFAPQHDILWFGKRESFRFPGNRPKSVLREARLGAEELTHPNEKPVGLIGQLIEALSVEGGTILDPFCGSGTTPVAAKKLGRHFLAFEIEQKYVDTSNERIALVEAQPGLFEKRAEQMVLK